MTSTLVKAVKEIIQLNYGIEIEDNQIQTQKTRKEFVGDLTIVVFPISKLVKRSPDEVSELLGKGLCEKLSEVAEFNVVKGFLNLVISDRYYIDQFYSWSNKPNFGLPASNSKPRIIIEYSSPNTNKPLHLGHLRNNFLGNAVARIIESTGHTVTKVQIINDRGVHICKSMYAWKMWGEGETPESSGIKGDKLVGKYYVEFDKRMKQELSSLIASGMSEEEAKLSSTCNLAVQEMLVKWESNDPETLELWNRMNGWVYRGFAETYTRMGVTFDKLYYESDTYLLGKEEVMKGLSQGVFYQKEDGSIWIDLQDEGLDEKTVLRKDGTAMYVTQDIGTAILRFSDFPDTISQIYTVGNEQDYHFKVLFKILEKLGWEQARNCKHLSYGMVELPEGKMKSREGTVVDADDLMAEMVLEAKAVSEEQGKMMGLSEDERNNVYRQIGMAALKYFLLRVDPKKNMMFNPKESIDFNGNTGPFIQYGYVRTQAIISKLAHTGGEEMDMTMSMNQFEKELVQTILEFNHSVEQSAHLLDPSYLASYTYEMTRIFNSFYQHCPILREENKTIQTFRLQLVRSTGDVLKRSMDMLGIEMPVRM
jgi:arginyl-tRNA synthetase